MAVILSATFTGCKKGEEDPFLSFKSRNSRIVGTWVLKAYTSDETSTTVTNETNNVNTEKTDKTDVESNNSTFDGTNLTTKSSTSNETTDTYINPTYSGGTWTYPTSTSVTKSTSNSTSIDVFSIELEISDDNTWTATYTSTKKSYSSTSSQTSGGVTTTTTPYDTTYSPANTNTWVEEGDWYWGDATDDKVIINAGPMQGKLKKLSSKEVIIEDVTAESDNSTDYDTDSYIYSYTSSTNPYDYKAGIKTTKVNYTSSKSLTATWEAKE